MKDFLLNVAVAVLMCLWSLCLAEMQTKWSCSAPMRHMISIWESPGLGHLSRSEDWELTRGLEMGLGWCQLPLCAEPRPHPARGHWLIVTQGTRTPLAASVPAAGSGCPELGSQRVEAFTCQVIGLGPKCACSSHQWTISVRQFLMFPSPGPCGICCWRSWPDMAVSSVMLKVPWPLAGAYEATDGPVVLHSFQGAKSQPSWELYQV